jgi:hypothetical protein
MHGETVKLAHFHFNTVKLPQEKLTVSYLLLHVPNWRSLAQMAIGQTALRRPGFSLSLMHVGLIVDK